MELHYLLFDHSDDESGRGSFDAMASVLPARLPALAREVESVLQWAHAAFGAPAALDDGAEWDCDLQAKHEPDGCDLRPRYDGSRAVLSFDAAATDGALALPGRITLTLTLGGSPAFCEAFRDTFGVDG